MPVVDLEEEGRVAPPAAALRASTRWLLVALLVFSALPRFWYASTELNARKHWDERFNLTNIGVILGRGVYEPSNYYYGALSYLPQMALMAGADALSRATGIESIAVFGGEGERAYTPFAYLLCRSLQVIWGVLSIVAAFAVGRRLFGPDVALLGAAILAASPRHLYSSSLFKPDVTLLLISLVAFAWILDTVARPTLRAHLLAGLGIGLATATKLNGAAIAIPLIVLTAADPRDRRRWIGLGAAGLVSILVFALISPGFAGFVRDLGKNLDHYDRTSEGGRLEALAGILLFFLDPVFHGPVVGLAAFAGLAYVALQVRRQPRAEALATLAFVSFPPLYTLLYVAATPRAKTNHFLEVLPFTSLAAAAVLVAGARHLARDWSVERRRRGTAIAVAAVAFWCAGNQAVAGYRLAVPRTTALAMREVAAVLPAPKRGREVVFEEDAMPPTPWFGLANLGVAVVTTADVSVLTELAAADAHVFLWERHPAAVPEPAASSPRGDGSIRLVRSTPFRAWGPDVVILLHPWTPVGKVEVALEASWRGDTLELAGRVPDAVADGEVVTLAFRVRPGLSLEGWEAELEVGGAASPLRRVRAREREVWLATPRLRLGAREVRLRGPAERGAPALGGELEVLRWSLPGTDAAVGP